MVQICIENRAFELRVRGTLHILYLNFELERYIKEWNLGISRDTKKGNQILTWSTHISQIFPHYLYPTWSNDKGERKPSTGLQ